MMQLVIPSNDLILEPLRYLYDSLFSVKKHLNVQFSKVTLFKLPDVTTVL